MHKELRCDSKAERNRFVHHGHKNRRQQPLLPMLIANMGCCRFSLQAWGCDCGIDVAGRCSQAGQGRASLGWHTSCHHCRLAKDLGTHFRVAG